MKHFSKILCAMAALAIVGCQSPSPQERSSNQVYDTASQLMEKQAEVSSAQSELQMACQDMAADGVQAEEQQAYQEICQNFSNLRQIQ